MSYYGAGSCSVLADEIKKRGLKKVFIVTDKDLLKFGVVEKVTSVLDAAKIEYTIFSNVKQNPTVAQVKEGVVAFSLSNADAIVAIGGGSPIDTAKGIGIISTILNLLM